MEENPRVSAQITDRLTIDLPASASQAMMKDFGDVQTYCMFLCHPRSGHSLVGTLLDAHPDIVVAHELNALKMIREGAPRELLFHALCRQSLGFTELQRQWNGYDYRVPNQWQGRYRKLKVIGDKKGGGSLKLLRDQPSLLQQLRETVRRTVKIFRVVRNPFDNITTMSRFHHHNNLGKAIDDYFSRCDALEKIRAEVPPEEWLDVYHEDLVAEPKAVLEKMCRFVGVATTADYLSDCANIVFKSPQKRRFEISWTPEQRRRVETDIARHTYLAQYSFDS